MVNVFKQDKRFGVMHSGFRCDVHSSEYNSEHRGCFNPVPCRRCLPRPGFRGHLRVTPYEGLELEQAQSGALWAYGRRARS